MVNSPHDYIDLLKKYGVDYLSFVIRLLTEIANRGMKGGIAINPSQRIDIIEPFIYYFDYVALMTVEPGFR